MNLVQTKHQNCCCCNSNNSVAICKGIDFEYKTCSNDFYYHECKNCGHIFLKNVPIQDELSTIYPPNYENYSKERNTSLAYKVKSKLDLLSLKKTKKYIKNIDSIIDIGCADGNTLDIFKKVFPSIKNIEGVEISLVAAKGAIEKGYKVIIGSADELNFDKDKYDVITIQQVIEHVYRPEILIGKLSLALKKGGLLIIETPTNECLDLKLFKKRYWGGYHIPRHFNIFSKKGIKNISYQFNLQLISEEYKPQPGHWIWTFHHLLMEYKFPQPIISFFYMTNPLLLGIFTIVELIQSAFTNRMSNMRIILKKV
mgnify:CR=1 FL=1